MCRSDFKNRIRAYRELFGYSQCDLACEVGLSRSAVSSLERGGYSCSAYTAYLLCSLFGCDFEDLFYIDKSSEVV